VGEQINEPLAFVWQIPDTLVGFLWITVIVSHTGSSLARCLDAQALLERGELVGFQRVFDQAKTKVFEVSLGLIDVSRGFRQA